MVAVESGLPPVVVWLQPMFVNNFRYSMPGFGIGLAAFSAYCAAEYLLSSKSASKH